MGYQKFKLSLHLKEDVDFGIYLSEPLATERNDGFHLFRLASQGPRHILQRRVEIEKLADFGEGKTNLMVAPDEQHAIQIPLAVISIARGSPRRSGKQVFSLVKANGLDIDANCPGKFSDLHPEIIYPVPEYRASVKTKIVSRESVCSAKLLARTEILKKDWSEGTSGKVVILAREESALPIWKGFRHCCDCIAKFFRTLLPANYQGRFGDCRTSFIQQRAVPKNREVVRHCVNYELVPIPCIWHQQWHCKRKCPRCTIDFSHEEPYCAATISGSGADFRVADTRSPE